MLPDAPAVYGEWRRLVFAYSVQGVKVHDARLVALMLANDVVRILTFNAADFRRYEVLGIRVVEPGERARVNEPT